MLSESIKFAPFRWGGDVVRTSIGAGVSSTILQVRGGLCRRRPGRRRKVAGRRWGHEGVV